jgi:hypothetical protein
MNRSLFALGLIALSAQVAAAQSVPNITKVKETAQKAATAANTHTATVSAPQEDSLQGAQPKVQRDSAGGTTSVNAKKKVEFNRETFSYDRGGRRDPFISLMSTSELRPLISDLRIVVILNDPSSRSSVAILRDLNTKEQYRIRTGQSLGRMRVAHIAQKSVTFTIEEFGYSRQEVLSLSDSNTERKK